MTGTPQTILGHGASLHSTRERRCWSADDLSALRRLVAAGLTDGQIGEQLDRCRKLVQRKRAALSLKPGQSPKMTAMVRKIRARRLVRARA